MALIELNTNPTRRELRQFAVIVLPAVAAIIAGLLWWRFQLPLVAVGVLVIAGALSLAGWVRPGTVRAIYVGWMTAAFPIGWIVSHLVLAVVFYGVLTPIGCVLRWSGRDSLQRRFDADRKSYWESRPPGPDRDPKRYFRQF